MSHLSDRQIYLLLAGLGVWLVVVLAVSGR